MFHGHEIIQHVAMLLRMDDFSSDLPYVRPTPRAVLSMPESRKSTIHCHYYGPITAWFHSPTARLSM